MNRIKIENWSTTSNGDPFTPPEYNRTFLQGEVYGHPDFTAGSCIVTSAIIGVKGREITTESGRVYILGQIHPDFRKWLRVHIPGWNYKHPIVMRGREVVK
jgi:hypothetical protein